MKWMLCQILCFLDAAAAAAQETIEKESSVEDAI
jgi:hypothetical protein